MELEYDDDDGDEPPLLPLPPIIRHHSEVVIVQTHEDYIRGVYRHELKRVIYSGDTN